MIAAAVVSERGSPPGVRPLEHTADVGIEVHARSLESLFARAAAGMFALFARPRARRRTAWAEVEVEGEGLPDLMVAWLDELVYRADTQALALCEFEVSEVSRESLRARVRGLEMGPDVEACGPAVKAVTRHALSLFPADRGWSAQVYFDV